MRDRDPTRTAQNKSRERPRQKGKFVKAQPDYVSITTLVRPNNLGNVVASGSSSVSDSVLRTSSAVSSLDLSEARRGKDVAADDPGRINALEPTLDSLYGGSAATNESPRSSQSSGSAESEESDGHESESSLPADEE